MQQWFTDL